MSSSTKSFLKLVQLRLLVNSLPGALVNVPHFVCVTTHGWPVENIFSAIVKIFLLRNVGCYYYDNNRI